MICNECIIYDATELESLPWLVLCCIVVFVHLNL